MEKAGQKILTQTHYASSPGSLRVKTSVDRYLKTYRRDPSKFRSNRHLFCIKYNSSLPEMPLRMEEVYLKRRSQRDSFHSKLKKCPEVIWKKYSNGAFFYNNQTSHFTVPCGGALYHYEIYICLFQTYLLPLGLYRYNPQTYTLALIKKGNFMKSAEDALNCYF